MKNTQKIVRKPTGDCVLYAKAGVLQETRKLIATGSRPYLEAGIALDRINPRKVAIVSKSFWENVLTGR
jgi:hypothetical protein